MEQIVKLSKDLREASVTLSAQEARFLVDNYYTMQENRKRANNQVRAMGESNEPHSVITWLAENNQALEDQIKRALDAYSANNPISIWMRSIKGIGPVISAGLLAYLDAEPPETVGHWWSFAGVNPMQKWNKGELRPWSQGLKTLIWKASDSFVKVSGGDEPGYYGIVYKNRKVYEVAKNEAGDYAGQAADALVKKKYGKETDAYSWYTGEWVRSSKLNPLFAARVRELKDGGMSAKKAAEAAAGEFPLRPMLPPAHIDARAKRYAVKLFLAHVHDVWYRHKYKKAPPLPYPIAHLGHAHYIAPPCGG
jgi:hypothetical protein